MRCYVQDTKGGAPIAVTPEGVTGRLLSPDGRFIIAIDAQNKAAIYEIGTGSILPIPGLESEDRVIRWSNDNNILFIGRPRELPVKVLSLDLRTGQRKTVKEITPSDLSGLVAPPDVLLTPDGNSYVYQLLRYLTTLYQVEGLK